MRYQTVFCSVTGLRKIMQEDLQVHQRQIYWDPQKEENVLSKEADFS